MRIKWDDMPDWIGHAYIDGASSDLIIEGSRYAENPVTFVAMKQLSELFGTDLINIGSEAKDDGYCETCSDPYDIVIVRISNRTKLPPGYTYGHE